jgi:hypothetical protein
MTNKANKTGLGLLAGLLAMAMATAAWGADQDSDSLTITVTPTVDIGVNVDTGTARFDVADSPGDLDITMALGATSYLVSPASVTILGSFNNQEVELQALALDSWAIDEDEVAEAEQVQIYALFASNKAAAPTEAQFGQAVVAGEGRHLIVNTVGKVAGEPSGAGEDNGATPSDNTFEIADGSMTGGANMDDLMVGNLRQLWLRVDAPPMSDTEDPQRLVITLTAKKGTTN